MVSQGCEAAVIGRVESGQASPREVPSITVREAGQMAERPSTSTDQRVGRGTMGTDEARVRGCEMR